MAGLLLGFSVIFLCLVTAKTQRVCTSTYITIQDIRRSTAYKFNTSRGDVMLCDRGLIDESAWYRFQSDAGNAIPTTVPKFYHCSTYAPIWMNGEHPLVTDGVVQRTACSNMPWFTNCEDKHNIKVVNCSGFYLYQLKNPNACNQAYCAGSKLPTTQVCSTTGESLPVCAGVVPKLRNLNAKPKDEDTELVRLECTWDFIGNQSNVEFEARWFADEKDKNRRIEKTVDGKETYEYIFEYAYDIYDPASPRNDDGFDLNKHPYCEVRARFKGGAWSLWTSSNILFTGISVHPTKIALEDCGTEGREVEILLRPHLPVRNKPVVIDISSPESSEPFHKICIRGRNNFGQCKIYLRDAHSIHTPLRIKLFTTCEILSNDVSNEVTFKLGTINRGGNNAFWNKFSLPEIKVGKTNVKKQECMSLTDPHFTTFDGRYFNFFGIGTYRLYRNSYFGTEVQTRQKKCYGASCNCGVAIKEGVFYQIFDMCDDPVDPNVPWWQSRIVVRRRHLNDSELNGFFTKNELQGAGYSVYLPSGVRVTIQRRGWGLNTIVRAPKPIDPSHKSDGLCGDFDGNPNNDFGQHANENDHGEAWSVTGKSIFDYKGDKILEEKKIDEDCKDIDICVCKTVDGRTEGKCGGNAVTECFPNEKNENYLTKGLCEQRRKRDADEALDDEDQDDIPPFNPPITNVTFIPTWPTKNGLTKDNVTDHCNKKLRFSRAGQMCGNVTGVNIDIIVQQCISDIQISENFEFAKDNFAALEKTCITNVYSNISYFKNTTDGKLQVPNTVLSSLCPNDCSSRGECVNSTCICDQDYTAVDCSIWIFDSPNVFDIKKSGLCDMRKSRCRQVSVYGYPLLDSNTLTCHIQEYKVIDSDWVPRTSVSLYPGVMTDIVEVKCSLPVSPVNIADYGNNGITAAGLRIAVSNNGVNASVVSMSFISYDSVCQECNTIAGCKLKTDACFIAGHCFAQNQSHYKDWCQQCLSEVSTRKWTKRQNNQPPVFQTTKVFYGFYEKVLRVQLRASDPENRTFQFSFGKNPTENANLTNTGLFIWLPKTNSNSSFVFKIEDECGAYTTLNATVVIKQCPCENGGVCEPDKNDLNGAGNFTCECPPSYQGPLCNLDVDECHLSPCFNGTCNNTSPGYYCVCNPGYTGRVCDIEIDECASSPCFLGVQCFDMVDDYSCGRCPDGYSGSGKTCDRIDGKIDECIQNASVCHHNATCTYSNGSYECQCMQGFKGDGKIRCADVNECKENSTICARGANCTNTAGSYLCACKAGYSGDGETYCTDIDECTTVSHICHANAVCTNTNGSYFCRCQNGYIGDGKNCIEDVPPRILSPTDVYTIVNKELSIQIRARDSDGLTPTNFTLLPNGTIENPSLSKTGLLTITTAISGSIFIRIEDVSGRRTIFKLKVTAMKCPCLNSGECYNDVEYPESPSDFKCKCEAPHSGKLCGIRPDPCEDIPCYPGLQCTITNDADGFTCENCPKMFEGDGKECKLKNATEISNTKSEITVKNRDWANDLEDKTSKYYKKLASEVTQGIREVYHNYPGFAYVIIIGFRQGSVVVEFQLVFSTTVEDPLVPLIKASETGKLGNMTIEEIKGHKETDANEEILGLNKPVFIVIVVAIAAFIVVTGIVISYYVRRRRVYRKERLSKIARTEKGNKAKDLNSPGESTGGTQIGLAVFENECALDEEK